MTWVNAVLQGILLGGLYALFACGLSLLFGVMRIINLAHGDIAVLGAFLIWQISTSFGINPFLALIPTLAIMLVLGYVLQKTMLTRALRGARGRAARRGPRGGPRPPPAGLCGLFGSQQRPPPGGSPPPTSARSAA